jgi:nitroimidazol reductase NimA-like FMN-containing flavoprotein (pyridoxamine 5'-phosphate oxidase superfamily)
VTATWFLYEDGCLYLAIPSSSAKGRNLMRNPRIAVMIDVRSSYAEAGLTASGEAEIISGDEAARIVQRVHQKYLTSQALADPQVGPAFAAMDDMAVRLKPAKWISWDMAELDAQLFSGAMSRNRYLKDLVT